MKGILSAVFLSLGLLAGLTVASSQIPAATTFGLFASLAGALVVGVSVMILSDKRHHRRK